MLEPIWKRVLDNFLMKKKLWWHDGKMLLIFQKCFRMESWNFDRNRILTFKIDSADKHLWTESDTFSAWRLYKAYSGFLIYLGKERKLELRMRQWKLKIVQFYYNFPQFFWLKMQSFSNFQKNHYFENFWFERNFSYNFGSRILCTPPPPPQWPSSPKQKPAILKIQKI